MTREDTRQPITAAEAAAFLGVTSSAVRHIVRRHGIEAVGRQGRAKLYWMHEIVRHAGAHDRLACGEGGRVVSH